MIRTEAIVRAVFAALFIYMLTVGGTFGGMLRVELAAVTLPLLACGVVMWLLIHWRAGWSWYRTPLDRLMILWAAVIALSVVANPLDARRMMIGVWYVLMYMGLWFVLTDVIANLEQREMVGEDAARPTHHLTPGATRTAILDGLLIGMIVVMAVAYWQVWLFSGTVQSGIFGFVRPGGTLGNPNLLATLTIIAMGISASRAFGIKGRVWRLILGLYFIVSFVLLLLTASRGGWLGGLATLATLALFWLLSQGVASPAQIRRWYAAQSGRVRFIVAAVVFLSLALLIVMGVVILLSFGQPGRGADLRTYIWQTALTMFGEKPLTGHGLFTFGKGLVRLNSMPPLTPHTQAHNWPLNIMAELGIPGLIAMLISIGVILWLARRNWLALSKEQRGAAARAPIAFIAAFSALMGYAVHHLFDVTAMMAAFAIVGLLLVMMVVMPTQPGLIAARWRRIGHPIVMAGMWLALFVTGLWGNSTNRAYIDGVGRGLSSGDYLTAAQDLDAVISLDPTMPPYHWQQGIFYGSAAYLTDDQTEAAGYALAAIDAFDRVNVTEPQVPGTWANRAGLFWQLGRADEALESWHRAALAAPDSWPLWLTYAHHAELSGRDDLAGEAYTALIEVVGTEDKDGVYLHPVLQGSALFQPTAPPLTGLAEVVAAWTLDGEVEAAVALWEAEPDETVRGWVIRALLADAMGDAEGALAWMARAERIAVEYPEQLWITYGISILDDTESDNFSGQIAQNVMRPDYINGINWWGGTLMRATTPRSFLPQAGYEWLDPLMAALIGESPNIQ